jgi:uncharacterized membrane protein
MNTIESSGARTHQELVGLVAQGAGAGAPCGLRSMLPLFLLSRALHAAGAGDRLGLLGPLASPAVTRALGAAAMGELVGDKTPLVPARTQALPLLGRALCGALAGAAATSRARAAHEMGPPGSAVTPSLLVAALAGAAGALVTSFAGYHLRRTATTRTGIPDLAVALLEDVVCLGLARATANRALA